MQSRLLYRVFPVECKGPVSRQLTVQTPDSDRDRLTSTGINDTKYRRSVEYSQKIENIVLLIVQLLRVIK